MVCRGLFAEDDLPVLCGGIVDRLHHLRGDNDRVDVRRQLFAGLDAVDERVDLILEMVAHLELRLILDERAVLRGVNREVLAVLQADAGLVADEVDVLLRDADVLCPRAVQGDDRAVRADHADDGIVDVVNAVVLRRACPHVLVGVALHVDAELAEHFARDGFDLRVAAAVHDDVEVVDAPVDQRAAAGDFLRREGAAEARDRAVCAEARVDVVDVAELAVVDVLLDQVDAVVEAVDNADVKHLARLMLHLLHLERFLVRSRSRLLAQDVLACAQRVDRDRRVHVVRRADRDRFHFRVGEHVVVIDDGLAAAVLFHGGFRALGDDVAEILDFRFRVVHVGWDVRCICNRTASDDGNFHDDNSFNCFP